MDFKTCYSKHGLVYCLKSKIVDSYEGRLDHSQYWNLSATADALIAAYMISVPANTLDAPTSLVNFSSFCNEIMQNKIIPSFSTPVNFTLRDDILASDGYKSGQKESGNLLPSRNALESFYQRSIALGIDNWNFVTQLHYSNIRGFWSYMALYCAWVYQLGYDQSGALKSICLDLLNQRTGNTIASKYASVWSTPSDVSKSYAEKIQKIVNEEWASIKLYFEFGISNQEFKNKIIDHLQYSVNETEDTALLDMQIKKDTKDDKSQWWDYLVKGGIIAGSLLFANIITSTIGDK